MALLSENFACCLSFVCHYCLHPPAYTYNRLSAGFWTVQHQDRTMKRTPTCEQEEVHMLRGPGLECQADCSALQWHDRHMPGSQALSQETSGKGPRLQICSTVLLSFCISAVLLAVWTCSVFRRRACTVCVFSGVALSAVTVLDQQVTGWCSPKATCSLVALPSRCPWFQAVGPAVAQKPERP